MAGGKETPRQKMVGLMYLVLLALLALQVGAEIMVKFLQLNNSLHEFTLDSQDKSKDLLSVIASKVKDRGNKPEEKAALDHANKLHDVSTNLIKFIEDEKSLMIKKTKGYLEDGTTPAGMKNTDVSSVMYLGDKKGTKEGKLLVKKLDDYIDELNKIYSDVNVATGGKPEKDHYEKLTLSGKEDPQFMKDPDQKNKSFLELSFDHTPMIAALAFLTEKQSKIAAYEAEILAKLKSQVGASDFKFDNVFAMALPESKIVAAGTEYKADMFISASSKAIQPTMKFGGKAIKVDDGIGTIKFKASGGAYDKEGKIDKTWKGEITIPHPVTGKDTTFKLVEKYVVTKPVIQVQSASISSLYKDCGNALNIQVPALGALYNPSFAASGAKVIKNPKKKGYITVIPTAATVNLTVSSGGTKIGVEKFKVRLVPKPDIVAYYKGKPANLKTGIKGCPRSIEIKAIAESNFKAQMKKDARFKVTKWEATLVRGRRPVMPKKSFSSGKGALSAFVGSAKPGDRIMIEVLKVKRLNYQNKKLSVKIPATIINIPLTD